MDNGQTVVSSAEFRVEVNESQQILARLQYKPAETDHFQLDVDLALPGRGVTAIYGASGSGKTSLLRCVAGLDSPQQGDLSINGEHWLSVSVQVPTHKRELGYVFQEASLFAHLTARQNLLFAQKQVEGAEIEYADVVSLMGIEPFLDSYPAQLSGGERQRVAIARALLSKPKLLLMDEPLASLDNERKQELLPYLEKLQQESRLPILYVTHSLEEVARLADYLVVINQGTVSAQGPLEEVMTRLELGSELGSDRSAVFSAQVMEINTKWELARVKFNGGSLWVQAQGDQPGDVIRVRILASDVSIALSNHTDSSILNRLPATVVELSQENPATTLVKLLAGRTAILARLSSRSVDELNIKVNDEVWAQIKSAAVAR